MKRLVIMAILGLSPIFHAHSMEVWAETKSSEKSFLISREEQKTCFSPSYPVINISIGYGSKKSSIASIKQLPRELQEHTQSFFLAAYLNEFGDEKKKELLSKHHPVLLINLIVRAERLCPLYLGNKEFGWKDVIVLKKKGQEDLSKICNQDPYYSLCVGTGNKLFCQYNYLRIYGSSSAYEKTYFGMLQNMPEHIKKNLVVNRTDDIVCCACSSIPIPALTCGSSLVCCIEGASLVNGTGCFVASGLGIGAFIWERIRQKYYSEKYYVDGNVVGRFY